MTLLNIPCAALGVVIRGVPMAINWWLMRADEEGPMWWANVTGDE
jgi:hypothetical protein